MLKSWLLPNIFNMLMISDETSDILNLLCQKSATVVQNILLVGNLAAYETLTSGDTQGFILMFVGNKVKFQTGTETA
jgi:hypothetical protein